MRSPECEQACGKDVKVGYPGGIQQGDVGQQAPKESVLFCAVLFSSQRTLSVSLSSYLGKPWCVHVKLE